MNWIVSRFLLGLLFSILIIGNSGCSREPEKKPLDVDAAKRELEELNKARQKEGRP